MEHEFNFGYDSQPVHSLATPMLLIGRLEDEALISFNRIDLIQGPARTPRNGMASCEPSVAIVSPTPITLIGHPSIRLQQSKIESAQP
jgi:hypothetical protein